VSSKCNKLNHFSRYCRSFSHATGAIEQGEDPIDSDDAESLFIDAIKNDIELTPNDCYTSSAVKFKADTGSQVNILPLKVHRKLKIQSPLKKSSTRLTIYSGGKPAKKITFLHCDATQYPILGLSASQDLGIVKIVLNIAHDHKHPVTQFPKLFKGLGCLKTPYHIQTDTSITPVVSPPWNQPVAIRYWLKQMLDDMERIGASRKVTDWVNSLVVVEEPKSKKLCLAWPKTSKQHYLLRAFSTSYPNHPIVRSPYFF